MKGVFIMIIEFTQEQLHLIQLALCSYELEFQNHIENLTNNTGINTNRIKEYQQTQYECNELFCYILEKVG